MPMLSGASTGAFGSGTRHTHIFKINPGALVSTDSSNWTTQGSKKYWNAAGDPLGTGPNGKSYLTLDMVCYQCHTQKEMSYEQLQQAAQTIHREGPADITVNGQDGLQTVAKGKPVAVGVSIVLPTAESSNAADIYVIAQGPKGYTSFTSSTKKGKTTTKWVSGIKPWYSNYKLPNGQLSPTTVLTTSTLAAGEYTYWMVVNMSDGTQYAPSVPVLVNTTTTAKPK